MYNVVDSFYAGKVSTIALAALGLSFPVFLLIIASSSGLSRGTSALVANAIGSGEESRKQCYVVQGFSLGLFVSAFLTVAGFVLAAPLFRAMGASGDYLQISLDYIYPIFGGAIFFVISSLANAILIAHGDSKTFSKVLVTGFFLNLVLDPWFLYGGFGLPAMGFAGIAWATVLIQFLSSVYMMAVIVGRGLLDVSSCGGLRPNLHVYREIAVQALPTSFNMLSVALSFFVVTWFLKFYGEEAVAAFGVTTRIEQIGLLPTFGLSAAILALVGQNNGAKRFDRISKTMRFCNRAGLALVTTSSIGMFIFARPLMRIFTSDPEVIRLGVDYLRIVMLIQWTYVMTSTHIAMLQAIKRPAYAFFESVVRKIIIPIPLLYVCVTIHQMDINWIWYCTVFTNILVTIVTILYAQYVLRKIVGH